MELQLTPDQELFVETTRRFIEDSAPVAFLRAMRDDPTGFNRDYWKQGAELGWISLLVSEANGGGSVSGNGLRDLALIAHEFGRHASPGPLLTTNAVASALSRSGGPNHAEVLSGLMSGEVIASWAYSEARPDDTFGKVSTTAEVSGDSVLVNGNKVAVEHGCDADYFLVTARTGNGLTQVVVPANASGVTVKPMGSVDLTRRFAQVEFSNVKVPVTSIVGEPGKAEADVEMQLHEALVIQTSESVGAMAKAFEITLEYSFDRFSFGRPLASYQALKHRYADMKMWLEASHAISDSAVLAVQNGDDDAAQYVSAAKSYIGQYGPELCQDCVQLHGGIGVTFEHDLHLYMRRVVLNSGLLGTTRDHRLRLTDLLEASNKGETRVA